MERLKSVGKTVLLTVAIYEISKLAFTKKARHEILNRDNFICCGINGEPCYGETLTGKPTRFQDGWMVTAAHYPEEHHHSGRGYHDKNPDRGRCLCQICNSLEENDRGNEWGAKKLLEMGIYKTKFLPHQEPIKQVYITLEEALEIREKAREITDVKVPI